MKVVVSDDYVPMDIFIGYDASTVEAYVACTGSIRENTRDEAPVIHGLNHRKLRAEALFDRKMDGRQQSQYSRKLWSSLMMINMNHPSNAKLTTEVVNTASGTRLHNFFWLEESEIGCLPAQWNWIEGISDTNTVPAGVHFSNGLPTHPGYINCRYATEWWEYLHSQLIHLGNSQNFEGLQP